MFLVAYRGQPVSAFALEEGIMQKRMRPPPGMAARGGSCGEGEHPCRGMTALRRPWRLRRQTSVQIP
jgi:hypothetical protein